MTIIRKIIPTSRFKKQYRKLLTQKPSLRSEFEYVIELLANDKELSNSFRDHKLKGQKRNVRELHILSDLLLVYIKSETELVLTLIETGSHSELFGNSKQF